MSYIRPLSNPEGLYIFSHVDGHLAWWDKKHFCLPEKEWKEFIFGLNGFEGERGDFKVEECFVQGEELEEPIFGVTHQQHLRRILTYKGEVVSEMWPTTWRYLVYVFKERLTTKKKRKP